MHSVSVKSGERLVILLLFSFLCTGFAVMALARPVHADVVGVAKVVDGDTIDVDGERIRLHGIDAPEKKQECGVAATAWPCGKMSSNVLMDAVAGHEVTCTGDKRDRYGRLIGICYVDGQSLNALMVREGWALAYRRYGLDYVSEEQQARAEGRGLWRGTFVEPWEWRRHLRAGELTNKVGDHVAERVP